MFDYDSDDMNEGDDIRILRSKVPNNIECHQNAPVMKSEPEAAPIQFIEKVMFIERNPFLGMDRGNQTDPIMVQEQQPSHSSISLLNGSRNSASNVEF